MVRSRVVALASMKPRFWEGCDWEKRRKASIYRSQSLACLQVRSPFLLLVVHAFFVVLDLGTESP